MKFTNRRYYICALFSCINNFGIFKLKQQLYENFSVHQ